MKRLDKKAIWIFFIRSFYPLIFLTFIFLPLMIMVAVGGEQIPGISALMTKIISVFIGAYVIFCAVWARLTYRYYFYELAEISFRQESGVIWKKYTSIPYSRIQNVDISRGPLDRILGISSIQIQTAAGGMMLASSYYGRVAEGILPGLSKETAEQLREELILRSNQSKKQGL